MFGKPRSLTTVILDFMQQGDFSGCDECKYSNLCKKIDALCDLAREGCLNEESWLPKERKTF